MTQHMKSCPRCQRLWDVGAAVCGHCGHRFRAQFAPPADDRTRLGALPALQEGRQGPLPRRAWSWGLLAAVLLALALNNPGRLDHARWLSRVLARRVSKGQPPTWLSALADSWGTGSIDDRTRSVNLLLFTWFETQDAEGAPIARTIGVAGAFWPLYMSASAPNPGERQTGSSGTDTPPPLESPGGPGLAPNPALPAPLPTLGDTFSDDRTYPPLRPPEPDVPPPTIIQPQGGMPGHMQPFFGPGAPRGVPGPSTPAGKFGGL